ncbi:LacI family DNA-binding transcriptional regulator [Indioceanicola profundi]|uniref:LacI family DNA-binding transcriptional regulator n=1 Tax=Indioceanicola profundi TaxID=2220096 RepID=UPI000E6ABB18|nr:LacI family DNA-binding transcriptional regulator [Indioceanicola profundi]
MTRAKRAAAELETCGPEGAGAIPGQIVWTLKRKPTINDVARLAQVSKKTVSRVINQSPFVKNETRDRIQSVIDQIGYVPDPQARGLASQRSLLIGLIYDNPSSHYIVNIQYGVLGACRRMGYELVVHPCDKTSPTFFAEVRQLVERQKLDGVILLPPLSENNELAALLTELECPFIRVVAVPLDTPRNTVVYHDCQAAEEVAHHLVELGHRRIGFISGSPTYRSAHERTRGFIGGLERHGVMLPPELIVQGEYTFETGEACADILLNLPDPPTAIFASNDEMAAGVYKAAYRRGMQIPEDIGVVGFDDSPLATRLWPALTTVRSPSQDTGRMAAEKLIGRVLQDDLGPVEPTSVIPRLVLRESVIPPRR